ncbi:MAG: MCP four helix bundle domain-containing protein, partial [Chloroflexi bacterium]|nr:MCP four helix bundle domain-containing protein [Chloroflexota bacterium]
MKLNIQTKLLASAGVLLLGLLAIAVVSTSQISQVGNQADLLYSQNLQTETKTGILRRDMLLMREAILEYPMAPAERRGESADKLAKAEEAITADIVDLRTQHLNDKQIEALANTEVGITAWYAARDKGVIGNADNGNVDAAANAALYGIGGLAFADAMAAIGAFATETRTEAQAAADSAVSTESSAKKLMFILTGISFVIGLGASVFVARGISNGVKSVSAAAEVLADEILPQLVMVTEAVASGDLTKT